MTYYATIGKMKRFRKQKSLGKRKYGWHLIADDMLLGYGDNRKVEVGKSLSIDSSYEPVLCQIGLHASAAAYGALDHHDIVRGYSGYHKLCKVVVSAGKNRALDDGERTPFYQTSSSPYDLLLYKFVGSHRKCLFMWDVRTDSIFKKYIDVLHSKIKEIDVSYRCASVKYFYQEYRAIKKIKNIKTLRLLTFMRYHFAKAYSALSYANQDMTYVIADDAKVLANQILEDMLLEDMKKQKEK